MPTYIDTTNLAPATIATLQGPIISQIQITDSSYTVLDDTAVANTGGYIKITGSNFTAGTQVVIGTVAATSVTYVNATTLNVQVPTQSAGTYVVYVTTNTGSVAILVNGLTYSGVPAWVTGSTLTGSQVDTPINIQLSATGDAPVTYALAAGSSLPPGLSLSSAGLISGTVTGITSETVYNFTVNATDAEAQDSPRSFSITISANDQYFDYVTSLLSASTPTSTFVTDASTNGFAVTVNGDTRPSNFGPYTPGYYSNFFDGTGDNLVIPASAAFQYPGEYTIEAWVYPLASSGSFHIFGTGSAGQSDQFNIVNGVLGYGTPSNSPVTGPSNVIPFAWNHVVLSRDSSNVYRVYLNGVSGTPVTESGTAGRSATSPYIGQRIDGSNPLNGYISNLRVVKGTAVYSGSSSFTPPTIPLTAIANTQLLTCQSNRFIDNSTNNFTITRNGDTFVSSFDPFLPDTNFAGRGSGFFDGTGDYLSVPDNEAFNFTGDFTIECWLYPTSHPAAVYLIGQASSTDYAPVLLYLSNGRPGIGVSSNGSTWTINSFVATALTLNTWSHVAMVRSGNKWSIYVNGVENVIAASTAVTPYNSTDPLGIGGETVSLTYPYFGYMTDVRIVKGTAVYTTNFTPPATPLTAVANTQLLTLQNNQPNNNNMFLDGSTNNFNITRNGNATQGAFTPYAGTWSVNFPNSGVLNSQSTSGAYLSIPNNAGFDMGTGDFTMEGWIYPQSFPSSDNWPSAWFQTSVLFGRGTNNLGDGYNLILGATRLIFQNSDTNVTNGLHNMVVNNWYHVAACRSSGTLRLFVNGVQVASTSFTSSVGGGSNFFIGCETGQGAYFNGYMSNIRVLKGTALYTGAFTPPTQPLIPTSSTSLLTCADNRFIDDSNYRSVVTATNSPTIQKFSPFAPQLQQTPTSYSVAFDGTGDYLSCGTNSAYAMGTGDFTWEAWVYFASGSSFRQIFSTRPSNGSSTTAGSLSVSNTNGLNWYTNSAIINYTTSIGTDQWVHVAICRSGTTIRAFANGVEVGSATNSDNLTASTFSVGANNDGSEAFNGCISNVRVVKGTALYTANFTPSTTPLTAVAGTSLLTCQNTTIIDNSTNNFAITVNGNSQPIPQNPFGYSNPASTGGYTPALYGGSGYFDGTGDYLSAPSTSTGFGTGDFTLELWAYKTGSGTAVLTNVEGGTNNNYFGIDVVNANAQIQIRDDAGQAYAYGPALVNNCWNHIAVTRASGSVRVFVNGVSGTPVSITKSITTRPAIVGAFLYSTFEGYFTGYISDVRITKGQARYTSNFVPPVAPLTAVQNTVLLNNMTGAGIYDSSMITTYETLGNSGISTSIKKYGNTSLYFDGTGDYLYAPWNPGLEFGAGNFTIEFWAYISGGNTLFCWSTDWHYGMTFNYGGATGNKIGVWASSNGSTWNIFNADGGGNGISTGTITLNTWTHVALVRNGSTWTLYLNGTSAWTGTSSATIVTRSSDTFRIGGPWPGAGPTALNGYLDDFRITNGIARYTASFTPPASPVIRF